MFLMKKTWVIFLWAGCFLVSFSFAQKSTSSPPSVDQSAKAFLSPPLEPIIGNWFVESAGEYKEELQRLHTVPLSPAEREKMKARVQENLKKKNLPAAVADQEFLAGAKNAAFQDWFQLALLLREKARVGKRLDYDQNMRAQKAAYIAYNLGEKAEQKAAVLLVLASTYEITLGYSPNEPFQLYDLAARLAPLVQVRKDFPQTKNLLPFQFERFVLNNEGETPGVCFLFSGNLKQSPQINISDYIQITPALDSAWQVNGRQVCALNLKFGESYKAVLKKGLPAFSAEHLPQDEVITFKVTDRAPRLSFVPNTYVLMKGAKGGVPLSSVNVDKVNLKILRINDRSLTPKLNENGLLHQLYSYDVTTIEDVKGQKLWKGAMDIGEVRNQSVVTEIPFSEVIKNPLPGIYLLFAEYFPLFQREKIDASQWIVVTDVGLSTFSGVDGLQVFARSLATAKPMQGIQIQLIARNNAILSEGTTDSDGKVLFDPGFLRGKGGEAPLAIYAYGPGGDFSLLNLKSPAFDLSDRGVSGREMPKAMDIFLYTERGVYRPGEKVNVTGLLRNIDAVAMESFPLTLKLLRPDGVDVRTDLVKTNLAGSFVETYDLKGFSQTGRWTLLAYADRKSQPIGSVEFSVEDFVPARLDFSLSLRQPFLEVGQPNEIALSGRYLFGAPAVGLKGEAQVVIRKNRTPFSSYKDYVFGLEEESFNNQRHTINFGPTDASGKGKIPLLVNIFPDTTHPLEVSLQVSLFEPGGRPRIKDLRLPFLKKALYLGIKPLFPEITIEKNEATFDLVALDEKGNPRAVTVEYELYREDMEYTWYQENPHSPWTYKAFSKKTPLLSGHVSTQEKAAVPLKLAITNWGQHRLIVKDSQTGTVSSCAFFRGWGDVHSQQSPDKLLVRLDQKAYHVKDTVQVYIKAPFAGEGQLLVMNNKILESRKISIPAEGLQVNLTATEKWGTGAYITVIAYNPLNELPQTKTLYPQPKRAMGVAWAAINLEDRRLHVDIEAPEVIRPRQILPVTLNVRVLDKAGVKKPADKVYVTLAAVDEGILGLTDFSTPNPLAYFLGKRRLGVDMRDLYGQLIETGFGYLGTLKTGGAALMAQRLSGITREALKPVSLFSGLVAVDETGKVTLPLNIPDFNGKIRLMAVAFTTHRYGNAEKDVVVQDPVVLEASAPRFLAPSDRAILTFSLHPTESKGGAKILGGTLTPTASGALAFEEQQPIDVAFQDQKSFYGTLPLQASNMGQGLFKLTFKNAQFQTEKNYPLTVRSASLPLTTSTLEQIPPHTEKKIDLKKMLMGVSPDQSALYLRVTPGLPWNMTFLLKSLMAYPYQGLQETVNKIFPLLYIKTPQIYPTELKNLEKVKNSIETQILYLVGQQSSQGYFSLWEANPDPWLTAYILNFWIESSYKGYTVPEFALKRGIRALSQFVQQTNPTPKQLPGIAYALYTLSQVQQIDVAQVRYFYETYGDQMPSAFGLAHIGGALALLGDLPRAEKAFEKAFSFFTPQKQGEAATEKNQENKTVLKSSLRDGAGVIALAFAVKQKVPTFSSFQDKIFSLVQTLSEMTELHIAEAAKSFPNNVFSLEEKSWLLIAGQFLQSDTEPAPLSLEVNQEPVTPENLEWELKVADNLLPNRADILTLKNTGKDPVWLMTALTGLPLKNVPASNGLDLKRRFYTLEGKEISVDELSQNAQVVVVLSGQALSDRLHQLVFTDLLPAGFEIENARIGQMDAPTDLSWLKELSKPQQTELRDDRYVALLRLPPDVRTFKLAYIVRAVTCGTFTYPASFVEDIYAPTFFNRTQEGKLTIVP